MAMIVNEGCVKNKMFWKSCLIKFCMGNNFTIEKTRIFFDDTILFESY